MALIVELLRGVILISKSVGIRNVMKRPNLKVIEPAEASKIYHYNPEGVAAIVRFAFGFITAVLTILIAVAFVRFGL